MALKRIGILLVFLGLWSLSLPTVGKVLLAPASTHRFATLGAAPLSLPGMNSDAFDKFTLNATDSLWALMQEGYLWRTRLELSPDWIFVSHSPRLPQQKQLVLREETRGEFLGENSRALYAEKITTLAEMVPKIEAEANTKVTVMLVPQKIFANDIDVSVWQVPLEHTQRLGIGKQSPRIGSETFLLEMEGDLRNRNISLISLVASFQQFKKQSYPLYPFGESHWSRELVYYLGSAIAAQLVKENGLAPECFYEGTSPSESGLQKSARNLGDLFDVIRTARDSSFAHSIETNDLEDFSKKIFPPPPLAPCPKLNYVGSSYGTVYEKEGDIAQSIALHYRGEVENFSEMAQGGLKPIRDFLARKHSSATLTIWEMPFRLLGKI